MHPCITIAEFLTTCTSMNACNHCNKLSMIAWKLRFYKYLVLSNLIFKLHKLKYAQTSDPCPDLHKMTDIYKLYNNILSEQNYDRCPNI